MNPFDQPGVESYKKNMFALLGKKVMRELSKELNERLKNKHYMKPIKAIANLIAIAFSIISSVYRFPFIIEQFELLLVLQQVLMLQLFPYPLFNSFLALSKLYMLLFFFWC